MCCLISTFVISQISLFLTLSIDQNVREPYTWKNLYKRVSTITPTSIPDGIINNFSIDFGRDKEIK